MSKSHETAALRNSVQDLCPSASQSPFSCNKNTYADRIEAYTVDGKMRKRTGKPSSYADAKKMNTPTLHDVLHCYDFIWLA